MQVNDYLNILPSENLVCLFILPVRQSPAYNIYFSKIYINLFFCEADT